ncbi:SDR family oxidoreductase [Streptomyces griseoluteus]|uniref:SDR family oxidoreductase n=1 Tax=Streptomyces griseoluteus TaxID=29306 RepID=UPI0036E98B81
MSDNRTDRGRFSGRVAVVTGASRGIGLAVTKRLVAEGARVCMTARGTGPLEEAAASFPPGSVLTVGGKADDREHRREVFDTVAHEFGGLDVLVNNAGVNPAYGPVVGLDLDAARKVRVNAVAPAVVKTRFAEALYEGREAEVAADYPLRRLGVPSDVASAVAYLASEDSSWVTGHVLTVDGGLTVAGGTA